MNKIHEIDVRNYMRVRKAHLTLDGNTFVVGGENEAGKSSFVQAIEDAFGGSKFSPSMPVRKGATEAVITISLSDGTGRVLKAELTHSKVGRRLTVKDADGKSQQSPQSIMDAFWAETSFDPSLFLISKPDVQVKMLKTLGGLDFTALDKEHADKFVTRTNVKRDADRLVAIAASKPTFPSAPKEEQSAASIVAEIAAAEKTNKVADDANAQVALTQLAVVSAAGASQRTRDAIVDAERRLAALNTQFTEDERIVEQKQTVAGQAIAAMALAQRVDVEPLRAKLASAEETNKHVRANADKAKSQTEARAKQAEADKLTDRLNEIAESKSEMLRNAKFPIPGMSIDGDDVTIDGIPLAQQSDMRRLAIGVEMAAVMNPGKPLMLVRHGNLFTPENFHILEDIASKKNLTCIVEIPGKNVAGAKLVFEDGIGVEPMTPEAQPELIPAT